MQMVYHSFEPVLSPALRKRYGESMSKFEKYVDQQVGEVGAPKGVSRKGLEGILGVLAVVSFISFLLVNPSISGNVVLSILRERHQFWVPFFWLSEYLS